MVTGVTILPEEKAENGCRRSSLACESTLITSCTVWDRVASCLECAVSVFGVNFARLFSSPFKMVLRFFLRLPKHSFPSEAAPTSHKNAVGHSVQ